MDRDYTVNVIFISNVIEKGFHIRCNFLSNVMEKRFHSKCNSKIKYKGAVTPVLTQN